MKSQLFKKEYIYPPHWDDEDICRFKHYALEAFKIYPNMPETFINICLERQINEEKGLLEPIDYKKIEKIKIETPPYEVFETII